MSDTKKLYFSFDAESDGLYGAVFAIGAVVLNEEGARVDCFSGKAETEKVRSEWVRKNSLPHLTDLQEYNTKEELYEAFWQFYMRYRESALIISDVPTPVEAGLLRACVESNLAEREFLAPYPLIDVASVLLAAGYDPLMDRTKLSKRPRRAHHPLDDAECSALALIAVLSGAS